MPTIDAERGVLVIRIVYDGPALSGKTTSMKTLAEGMSRKIDCPGERDGRTLFFDWVDYVGGLYEGRQIRCQIVSVPGQRELSHRRKALLDTADAVVCVLDSREQELSFGLEWLAELCASCRAATPPVGIVLQANKRDAADALPKEDLRARVNAIAPVAIVESVATSSTGIREAFVLSVRLALDRVRALSSEARLESGPPREDAPADLMRLLERADREVVTKREAQPSAAKPKTPSTLPPPPPTGTRPRPPELSIDPATKEKIFVPDPMIPGGMIWPPVDGRTLLHEVAGLAIRPFRTPRGDWWGSGSGFRFHSSKDALFADPNDARAELLAWARMHAINAPYISVGRAVILASAGENLLRLWQLVRVEPALRERLAAALALTDASDVARALEEVAIQLLAARSCFAAATPALPCTLWTVGAREATRPPFVGLMPEPTADEEPELTPELLVRRELGPHLRELRRARVDYAQIAREITASAEAQGSDAAAHALRRVIRAIE